MSHNQSWMISLQYDPDFVMACNLISKEYTEAFDRRDAIDVL